MPFGSGLCPKQLILHVAVEVSLRKRRKMGLADIEVYTVGITV